MTLGGAARQIIRPQVSHSNAIDQRIKSQEFIPGLEVTASSISSSRYWREEVPDVAALQRPAFSRLRPVNRVDEKDKSDDYPEIVGTVTLILGKAFGSLEEVAFGALGAGGGTTLGCFGAFSIGAGEDVRGRFEDCPVGAVARTGVVVGS